MSTKENTKTSPKNTPAETKESKLHPLIAEADSIIKRLNDENREYRKCLVDVLEYLKTLYRSWDIEGDDDTFPDYVMVSIEIERICSALAGFRLVRDFENMPKPSKSTKAK